MHAHPATGLGVGERAHSASPATRRILAATLWVLAFAVVTVGAYAAYWYIAANLVEDRIRTWAASPRGGLPVTVGTIVVGGFPNRFVAVIDRIDVGDEASGARYHAESVRVTRRVGDTGISFAILGPQSLTMFRDTSAPGFRVEAERFAGTLRLRDDGTYGGFNLDVAGLRIQRPVGPLTVRRLSLQAAVGVGPDAVPDGTRAAVVAEGVTIPEQRRGPFGDTLALVSANLLIERALSSLTLTSGLPQWQQDAGRLYLSDAAVRWGTLDLGRLGGTLRLDSELRLGGRLDGVFRDPAPVFDALAAAGWIDTRTRLELANGVAYDPNRALVKPYRAEFLGGKVVLDDIEQDQTAPIELWTVPPASRWTLPPFTTPPQR